MGIKCPTCKKVYVPPRTHCPTCFARMSEWVKLSGKGTLETYTIVRYARALYAQRASLRLRRYQAGWRHTGIVHLIGGVDLNKIKVGMKMEPVFKEKREGSILDIDYFKPA